ncbi:MAG: hypothetical protein ACI8RD_009645, partial [Bacillariaceae sp.]
IIFKFGQTARRFLTFTCAQFFYHLSPPSKKHYATQRGTL